MRPFEIALFLSCLPALVLALFGVRSGRILESALLFTPVVIFGVHALTEGVRLHLTPLYLVAIVLGLAGSGKMFASGPWLPWFLTSFCAFCGLILAAGGVLSGWIFPVFDLPPLTGPYRIGTTTVHFDGDLGARAVDVQFWYPVPGVVTGRRAFYLPEGDQAPSRLFSNLEWVRTHAFADAEVAASEKGWPVVLYSSSWDGRRFENTVLCETLASEGFVVAAIDHAQGTTDPPLDFSSEESFQRFQLAASRELDARTSDLLQVFSALPKLQAGLLGGGRFKDKLDPVTTGAIGYSFGGAVAAEACFREPRLRAGVNLDGTLFGQSARDGAAQPFLFITDTVPPPPESELRSADPAVRRNAEFYAGSWRDMDRWLERHGGWLVQIEGVRHANFCDRPLFSRLTRYTGAGTRDAVSTRQAIDACVVAFFNKTLRGQSGELLSKDSTPWPGVAVRFFPPPSE